MQVQPYLNFDGRCEDAVNFYQKALDAKVDMLVRMKEAPPSPGPSRVPPGSENKIMHVTLRIGDSIVMGSDCECAGQVKFQGFSLSLALKNAASATKYFNALSDGGKIEMPLSKTFFAEHFGIVTDRFGVNWMVIVQP